MTMKQWEFENQLKVLGLACMAMFTEEEKAELKKICDEGDVVAEHDRIVSGPLSLEIKGEGFRSIGNLIMESHEDPWKYERLIDIFFRAAGPDPELQ